VVPASAPLEKGGWRRAQALQELSMRGVRVVRGLLWTVSVAWLGLLSARPSEACSHPPAPPGPPYLVVPADGATGVPTNVVMTVYGGGCFGGPSPFELRDPSGTAVALAMDPMGEGWGAGYSGVYACRIRVAAPLAPGTTYDLVFLAPGDVDGGAPLGIGSFTTGDATDEVAPGAPVISLATLGERHACGYDPPEACCVSVPLMTATIQVEPVAEPLFYSLREGDAYVAVDVPVLEPGIFACGYPQFAYEPGPGRLPTWWVEGAVHELALSARDLAGHESPVVYVTLSGACSAQDEGTGALPGAPADDAAGDGCGCSVGRSPPPAFGWLPLALGLAAHLQRRARRRSRA
jgi:MYXO-CTERM domain-containing protein